MPAQPLRLGVIQIWKIRVGSNTHHVDVTRLGSTFVSAKAALLRVMVD